ncbi:MAG TPA: glycosyltransferase family 2 protein [Opitutales bacterium]|jgi:dTDP-glucose pyrophosphorylase|nr:glycosyltransferase family 2 protein [Opitutales bacterium]
MNVLLLMAGPSDKFREAGHTFPKNLVEIEGRPIMQRVLENVFPLIGAKDRLIVVLNREEIQRYHTDSVARLLAPKVCVREAPGKTAGAACSALLAIEQIDNDQPLVICNGDQVILADLPAALADFKKHDLDGGVIVFEDVHPRWSFVKCNAEGLVVETAEKRPISKLATAGFYYFKRGRDFVRAAERMIIKDSQVDGLFYVCPAYNELLLENARVGVHMMPRQNYFSLATPQGAQIYTEFLKQKKN